MKLWLISQDTNSGYDTYDSAVVAAKTEDDARNIHPGGGKWKETFATWANTPDQVTVKLIGEAAENTEAGVVCASFNAG